MKITKKKNSFFFSSLKQAYTSFTFFSLFFLSDRQALFACSAKRQQFSLLPVLARILIKARSALSFLHQNEKPKDYYTHSDRSNTRWSKSHKYVVDVGRILTEVRRPRIRDDNHVQKKEEKRKQEATRSQQCVKKKKAPLGASQWRKKKKEEIVRKEKKKKK